MTWHGALLARGLTGKVTMLDANTGKHALSSTSRRRRSFARAKRVGIDFGSGSIAVARIAHRPRPKMRRSFRPCPQRRTRLHELFVMLTPRKPAPAEARYALAMAMPVTDPVSSERALKRQPTAGLFYQGSVRFGLNRHCCCLSMLGEQKCEGCCDGYGQFAHVSPLVLKICGRA